MNDFYTTATLDITANEHPTVLVVEDEPAIRGLLAEFLRGEGYEVALARDGSEALDLLSGEWVQHHPSVVLLDMMLPEVDGVSVLKELAARGPQVPVVAMSASYEALGAALAAGANAAVPKPFDLERLLVTLERQTLTAA